MTVEVTLRGAPGTDVEIRWRGDRDADEQPPPILIAATNSDGLARLTMQRGYFVVRSSAGTTPLALHETDADAVTVDV